MTERKWRLSFTAAAVVLAVFSSCRCEPKLESAVDAPVTIEQAKAKAAPPDVVVTVERITRPAGGAGCGHSPLCVIFLPVILWSEMFPEKYDEVVITDHGKETYRGAFSVKGDFLQARVVDGGGSGGDVRDLRQLRLQELDKRIVVVIARGADAEHMAPVPIVPQVDLVTEYRSAIQANAKNGAHAAALDVEALTWLDKEALPLVQGRMSDAATSDAEKAHVVASLCASANGALPGDSTAAAVVDAVAKASPGPRASIEALKACAAPSSSSDARIDAARAQPFVDGATDALCKRNVEVRAIDWRFVLQNASQPLSQALQASAQAHCTDPAAKAFVALSFGTAVDDAALTAALKTPWAADLLADPHALAHTPLVAAALDDDDLAANALDTLLDKTPNRDAPPAPELAVPLARRYAKGVHALFCTGYEREAAIVQWLTKAPPSSRADIVKALRDNRTDKRGAVVDAGLVVFGADVDGKPIKKVLGTSIRKKDAAVCDDAGVIRAALALARCSDADLDKPRLRCAGVPDAPPDAPPASR